MLTNHRLFCFHFFRIMKRSKNTASSSFVMLIFSTATMAAFEFKVGDDIGWQLPPANNTEFYNYWASINRFKIDDSLSFEYKNDSVLMVEKWDYYHCNSSHPIVSFNNGNAVIKLDRSGPFYFISAFPNHCKNGQRLLVEVMSLHLVAPSPESYPDASPPPSSHSAGVAVPVVPPLVVLIIMVTIVGLLLFCF